MDRRFGTIRAESGLEVARPFLESRHFILPSEIRYLFSSTANARQNLTSEGLEFGMPASHGNPQADAGPWTTA